MTDTTTPQTQMSGRDINQVRQILTNEMGLTRETIRDIARETIRGIAQRQTGVSNEAWAAYVEMLEPSAQWLEVCRPAGQQLKVVVHDGAQSYDATVDGSDLLRLYASVSGVGEWLVDLCLPVADYVADKGVLVIAMAPALYSGAEQSIVGWAEWGDGTEPFGAQTCVFGKVRGGYDAAV